MGKIISLEEAAEISSNLKKEGKMVVFTNGVFDLLHAGHLSILEKARALGDSLFVGINSDGSVRKIKGPERPIINENERARMLCGLTSVDYVVIFHEETPEDTIKAIKPDVHAKGGDWEGKEIPEAKIVESYGGTVKFVNSGQWTTTTKLIEKIRKGAEG